MKKAEQNPNNDWKDFLGIEKEKKEDGKLIKRVVKRNAQIEIYDRQKIFNAINSAAKAVGKEDPELVDHLTTLTEKRIQEIMMKRHPNSVPGILNENV